MKYKCLEQIEECENTCCRECGGYEECPKRCELNPEKCSSSFNNWEHCNHRYDGRKCVKCGKPMPGSGRKIPNYEVERVSRELVGRFFGGMFDRYLRRGL